MRWDLPWREFLPWREKSLTIEVRNFFKDVFDPPNISPLSAHPFNLLTWCLVWVFIIPNKSVVFFVVCASQLKPKNNFKDFSQWREEFTSLFIKLLLMSWRIDPPLPRLLQTPLQYIMIISNPLHDQPLILIYNLHRTIIILTIILSYFHEL